MKIEVVEADYNNEQHAKDIISLLNHYANDPMGGGKPLSKRVADHLIEQLSATGNAFSILVYGDSKAIGMANCFFGFSTFKCKPLVNIHDFVVLGGYRGNNISQLLLRKIEGIAGENGCCKITLEVLEGNIAAQKAYSKFGFGGYELDPKAGRAMFWEKAVGST